MVKYWNLILIFILVKKKDIIFINVLKYFKKNTILSDIQHLEQIAKIYILGARKMIQ